MNHEKVKSYIIVLLIIIVVILSVLVILFATNTISINGKDVNKGENQIVETKEDVNQKKSEDTVVYEIRYYQAEYAITGDSREVLEIELDLDGVAKYYLAEVDEYNNYQLIDKVNLPIYVGTYAEVGNELKLSLKLQMDNGEVCSEETSWKYPCEEDLVLVINDDGTASLNTDEDMEVMFKRVEKSSLKIID